MNFQEAEARFRWLEGQRAVGRMNERTYRNELNQLRVVDARGRHWMIQKRTGQWHVYDGRQWTQAAPPIQPVHQSVAPRPAPAPVQAEHNKYTQILLYLVPWFVIWVIIAGVVYNFFGQKEPKIMLGVAGVALLSLARMLFPLADQWQGQIVELKVEGAFGVTYYVFWHYFTVAYIRQPNGRIRRVQAMNGWQVGDRLEKRRGEANVRVMR